MAGLAKAVTDTGRLEVDYLRVSGGGESPFLQAPQGGTDSATQTEERDLPNGVVRVVQHRLKG